VFPKFDEVKPEHVVPGMRALLAELHAEIDALEANVTPTWEGLVEPLERISDRHQRTWGVVSHLKVRGAGGWGVRVAAGASGATKRQHGGWEGPGPLSPSAPDPSPPLPLPPSRPRPPSPRPPGRPGQRAAAQGGGGGAA
jgi:hypothetical protein